MGLEDDVAAAMSEEARRHNESKLTPPQPDAELLSFAEELRAGLRRRGVTPRPVYRLERVHRGYYTPGSYFSRTFVPPEAYARPDELLGYAWTFREANKPLHDSYLGNKTFYLMEEPLVLFTCEERPMRGEDPQTKYPAIEGSVHWAFARLGPSVHAGAVAYLRAVDRGESDWLGPDIASS